MVLQFIANISFKRKSALTLELQYKRLFTGAVLQSRGKNICFK